MSQELEILERRGLNRPPCGHDEDAVRIYAGTSVVCHCGRCDRSFELPVFPA